MSNDKSKLKFFIKKHFKNLLENENKIVIGEDLTQNKKGNFDIIYKDSIVTIVVPKTFEACVVSSKNTAWCSQYRNAYNDHKFEKKNVLFRILFKDGNWIRLTWDAINKNELSWGHKGKVGDFWYVNIFGKDFKEIPFVVHDSSIENWKEYNRKEQLQVIKYINSLSHNAKEAILNYYENYRNMLANGMFEKNDEYIQYKADKEKEKEQKLRSYNKHMNINNVVVNEPIPSKYDPTKKQFYMGGEWYDI
jgi:hypothetical protein